MVESLYKAIAAECRSSVPELKKIYRDNIPQNMEFPCILVEITETTANRRLSERQRIKQNFDVQYFPGDESENCRKECEKVKQKMLRRFDVVSADGISFYVRNKNASIVDDVLHLMFYVTYTEYEKKEIPKMEEMNTNIETEEKDGRNMGKPE